MIVKAFFFQIFILLLWSTTSVSGDYDPIINLNFDNDIKSYKGIDFNNYDNNSSSFLVDGITGNGLHLSNSCFSIKSDKFGSNGSGTVMFWLKPKWDYYENMKGRLKSHSFVSMKWSNGGYFVLSDGWWEKNGGSYYTYFIYNNKKFAHTKSKIIYKKDQWIHLAVTWNSSKDTISLYHNGALLSAKNMELKSGNYAKKIIIGCDLGTNLFDKRWMNGVIDDLKIYKNELNANQIYSSLGVSQIEMEKIKYGFLTESIPIQENSKNDTEKRIMFDSYPASWQTKKQARDTINRLYKAGINIYIPCVWYGDGARFNSKVAPTTVYKGKDKPFENLIKVAHEYGIEVHPWITVVYRSKTFLNEFYEQGTPPKAFEVHNKKFRDYMVEFIADLVTRYDVDGVNLDYIRTMGVSKSKTAIKLFNQKFNRSLIEEVKKIDSNNSWNQYVQEFVNEPIDDLVRRISKRVRSIKPNIIISVDGHPKPFFLGESRQGRNELKWLNEGLIDVIYSMSYSKNIDYKIIDLAKKDAIDSSKIIIVLGIYEKEGKSVVSRSTNMVEKLITFSRVHWGNGIALYPYSSMSKGLYGSLKNNLFKNKTRVQWAH